MAVAGSSTASLAGALTTMSEPLARQPGSGAQRPNLLLVFADMLGRNHVGYAGARHARTPHIDAFRRQSVDFSNSVASMPVCSAFRATLLTGKYTTSTGMVINELRMDTRHRCLGHVVTDAGYQTAYIGKWHLYANELGNHEDPKNSFVPRGPNRLGFDGFWAAYGFHHIYWNAYYHTESPEKIFFGKEAYEPDGQTDLMIKYLREQRDLSKSFCAVLSYGTPHDPWTDENTPVKYREMFNEADFPNPPNYLPSDDPYNDNWAEIKPEHRPLMSHWRKNYYAMTTNLDDNFGRLLKYLDESGLADNTIVVFSSDHGEMFGAHGRRAKNIFYEEAARVPFVVRWPGHIPANSASDACISNVDFMPTLLGLMELPIPDGVEGMNLSRAALSRLGAPEPEAAFLQNTGACAAWTDGHEWRALRDKRFTYAIYRRDKAELLFDNQEDPYQMHNLAKDPAHAATMKRFREMLASKMKSINDGFKNGTWYRDNWTKDRIIIKSATMPPA